MKLLWVLCLGLAVVGSVWSAVIRKPDHPLTQVVGSRTCYSGELYLGDHADTALVKKFGFRRFEFLGRSVGSVRYHAIWPVTVQLDSLPQQLHDISFDVVPPVNTMPPDTQLEYEDDWLPPDPPLGPNTRNY